MGRVTSWKDRQVDMSEYEVEDDEPLDEIEMNRLESQRALSQAALISRAAHRGMTPMELFATGEVSVQVPNDRLAYDKSRQLPAPELKEELVEEVPEGYDSEGCYYDRESESKRSLARLSERHPSEQKVPAWERPKTNIQSRIDEWLANGGGAHFMEGFNSYGDVGGPGFANLEALKNRKYCKPHGQVEPCPQCSGRASAVITGTPPTRAPEAVPQINDDEIAEGEIFPDVKDVLARANRRYAESEDDIIDAEVVEDEAEES